MGRKKRDFAYVLPFCFYCDKTFPTEIVLHQHQKSKHFTCKDCGRRFPNTMALVSHAAKQHSKTLEKVPHSVDERGSPDLNIFGMVGVPKQSIQERAIIGAAKAWAKVDDLKRRRAAGEVIGNTKRAQNAKVKQVKKHKPKHR